jgi:hypothetical protein
MACLPDQIKPSTPKAEPAVATANIHISASLTRRQSATLSTGARSHKPVLSWLPQRIPGRTHSSEHDAKPGQDHSGGTPRHGGTLVGSAPRLYRVRPCNVPYAPRISRGSTRMAARLGQTRTPFPWREFSLFSTSSRVVVPSGWLSSYINQLLYNVGYQPGGPAGGVRSMPLSLTLGAAVSASSWGLNSSERHLWRQRMNVPGYRASPKPRSPIKWTDMSQFGRVSASSSCAVGKPSIVPRGRNPIIGTVWKTLS